MKTKTYIISKPTIVINRRLFILKIKIRIKNTVRILTIIPSRNEIVNDIK